MSKNSVPSVSTKLSKVSDSFTVNMYDNGFMLEISGRDDDNDWKTAKILCSDQQQLMDLIAEVVNMAKDD